MDLIKHIKRRIELLEVLFVLAGLVGVAAVFWPAALILAGILGVVACERHAQTRIDAAKAKPELRQVA